MTPIMGRAWNRSIFGKVLTGYVALTFFVVALTAGMSHLLVLNYVINSNMQELLAKAESITSMITRANAHQSGMPFFLLKEYESLTGARMILVDANMAAQRLPFRNPDSRGGAPDMTGGTAPEGTAADSQADGSQAEDEEILEFKVIDALDQAMVRSIMDGNAEAAVRQVAFLNAQVLFAGSPIVDKDGNTTGAVILYRLLTDVRGVTINISVMLGIAGVLAVLLAIGLSLYLSRRLTRPLSLMNSTAKRMAEGHYGERVHIAQSDEIGQLGGTLNLMSSRLSEVIARLNDEKSKLQQILASIGEGIVAVDRDGQVVHHNAAALELLELEAWPAQDDAPPLHQEQLILMLKNAMEGGGRAQTTWKSGADRSIAAIVSPVLGAGGEVIGAVGLMRDVSESARLEQLRRDYVANISHELRTPLTGIRGMVEPLMDGYIETEREKADCYQVIYQETLRLEKLIGEMLDISRLQDGRLKLELEPMELPGVMEAAVRRMRDRALAGQVKLGVVPDGDIPPVMGNEDRILQVLIILLDNALSFTPPGGVVDIFARSRGDWVSVGVRDSGVGIDPKDLPYIWERFYKADRSRLRTSGTGLGLSIAKLVVELMGGEIGVKSEPGKGATFEFTLKACRSFNEGEGGGLC